jgi:hypothetical protein
MTCTKDCRVFLTEKGKMELENLLHGDELNSTAYLADMFSLLNQLNNSLQGHNSNNIRFL